MNKELANLQDLKSAFVSHCKTLNCENNYIKVCENKFDDIETALKDFEWLKHKLNLRFLNSLSSPEDKMRVMKIMGVEYDETYTK